MDNGSDDQPDPRLVGDQQPMVHLFGGVAGSDQRPHDTNDLDGQSHGMAKEEHRKDGEGRPSVETRLTELERVMRSNGRGAENAGEERRSSQTEDERPSESEVPTSAIRRTDKGAALLLDAIPSGCRRGLPHLLGFCLSLDQIFLKILSLDKS